jgi:type IV secretory pathway VirB10-like protein
MAKEPLGQKRTQTQSAQNANLVEAIVGDLKGLSKNEPGSFVVSFNSEKDPVGGQSQAGEGDRGEGLVIAQKPNLEVGTILYAVTELAVDSDVPAPVMARVVEGKFSGVKFIGGFGLRGEKLTLSFTQMIDPQSGTHGVEALAVDPNTDSPAISGKVDTHFLSRWGGLVASSFLEGFGGALSDRGTTVSVYGDVVAVDKDRVSYGDISLEALGQVGSRAATQLEKNFDRAPTVTIPAGSQIGLLILSVKD